MATGWNGSGMGSGSTPIKPKVTAKKPSPVRGLVAGAVLVAAVIAVCMFLFSGKDAPEPERAEAKKSVIREVTPAKPKAAVEEVKLTPKEIAKRRPLPKEVKRDKNGILRWPSGARFLRDYYVDLSNGVDTAIGPERIFTRPSERLISSLFTAKVGGPVIAGFKYGDGFVRDLEKAIKEKIEILETDTPEERQLKQDVIQAKEELAAAMARGEDPKAIMQAARDEMLEAFQYKHNLEQQLVAIRQNPELTAQDVSDAYEAANMMLEQKGIPKLSMTFIRRRLERMKNEGAISTPQKQAGEAKDNQPQEGVSNE